MSIAIISKVLQIKKQFPKLGTVYFVREGARTLDLRRDRPAR